MGRMTNRIGDLLSYRWREDTYSLHQLPREGIADEELGLFPFLDLCGAKISSCNRLPVYLIEVAEL
jgi:hypothetical protein